MSQRQQSANCDAVVHLIGWNDPRRCVDGLVGLPITAAQCFDSPAGKPGVIVKDPAIGPLQLKMGHYWLFVPETDIQGHCERSEAIS